MNIFLNTVKYITSITKWAAYGISSLMVLLVFFFATSRAFGHPIVGDIEIVQFTMVLLIVFSLAYTEETDSHVAIDLIYNKLPSLFQLILKVIAKILTILFCFLVCWIFISKMDFASKSSLLLIVYYPFKIMLIIGFFAWGLEAVKRGYIELKRYKNPNYFVNGE
jgi:TRAP-type C4-dicarboxylate transport system permease small subunit